MRTFRFTSEGTSSSDPQQQTIDCDLHLEPSANIVQEQAADCSCHTQEDCQGRSRNPSPIQTSLKLKFILRSHSTPSSSRMRKRMEFWCSFRHF